MSNRQNRSFKSLQAVAAAVALAAGVAAPPATAAETAYPQPLALETIPATASLPSVYPDSWMLVHDFNFVSILDGRAAIVDVMAADTNLKGQIPVAQFGTVIAATKRAEIYTGDTFYSRLTRGERTDVVTIWDKATLAPKGEIALPGNKRGQMVTIKNAFQLVNDEKWLLVYGFTPAASVYVVDLEARKVISEVDIPGCSMMYPTGQRSFSTLCADGTLSTITLDAAGQATTTVTSPQPVNDLDQDPMFMMPAMVGRTAWFATFKGQLHGFDFSGATARDLGTFSLGTAPGAAPEWRPGGWQVVTSDKAGRVYVLMNPNGRDGSHKDGGSDVWVMDPVKRVLVQRIPLETPGVSIEATRQAQPRLVVSRADGVLDVYDVASGKLERSLGGGITLSPMTMSAFP
jgi:methylamine dehydrogenase heavy chain